MSSSALMSKIYIKVKYQRWSDPFIIVEPTLNSIKQGKSLFKTKNTENYFKLDALRREYRHVMRVKFIDV